MSSPLKICDREIITYGKLIRFARIQGDKYRFLDNPEPLIEGLRKSGERIDIFTFIQRLPETEPKYRYPMEWDNFAALPITTFDNWWTKQIGFKARNKAKQESSSAKFRSMTRSSRESGRSTTSAPSVREGHSAITGKASRRCAGSSLRFSIAAYLSEHFSTARWSASSNW